MVQNEAEVDVNIKPSRAPKGVPEGQYCLVGWAIDTTGRRLIDEICQIAAYTPASQYSQHIMPFSNLNPGSRRRHNLRIINLGRYRQLKSIKTNKVIKTKSEVSALTDFITWLESVRGAGKDGVILVFHEFRKTSPGMLLEALRRYNLIDAFSKVVKGFANGFNVSSAKCRNTTKSYSLRVMSRMLLNKEDDFGNAVDRAQAAYEIVIHLGQSELPDLQAVSSPDPSSIQRHLSYFVKDFVNPITAEEDEIARFKILLERQNTFRPVFGALLRATFPERRHASRLRRLLAENNIDYDKLKAAYENSAKEGIEQVLKSEVPNAQEKELKELLEIFDCFFDPEKTAVQPKPRFFANNTNNDQVEGRRRRRSRRSTDNNKENNNDVTTPTENSTASPSSDSTPRSETKVPQTQVQVTQVTQIPSQTQTLPKPVAVAQ